ncbi:MAG: DUF2905 family protein [Candidatus Hydrogenedentes bacterium]|nr:DUF2905 family protein [Candidatus Hydrogenedentota bacterium]
MDTLAKTLIALGIVLIAAGLFLYLGGKVGFLGLGRLPGDIRVERDNFSFYFPITTSILISVVISAVLYLLSRFR